MEWAITLWDGGPPPDPAGWKPWVTSRVGALQEISEAIATQLVGGRWEQSPDPRRLALERATLLRELRPPRHFGIYATRDARSPAQTRQLERVWRQSAAELARSWTCARWLADEGGSKRLRLRFGDEIDGLQRDLPALLELMRPNLVERPRAPDGPSGRWDAAVRRARAGLGEWKHERPLGSIGAESRDLAAPTDDEDAID